MKNNNINAQKELENIEAKYRKILEEKKKNFNILIDFDLEFAVGIFNIEQTIKKIRDKMKKKKEENNLFNNKIEEEKLNEIENEKDCLVKEEENNLEYYLYMIKDMELESKRLNKESKKIQKNVFKGIININLNLFFKYEKKIILIKEKLKDLSN